MDRIFKFDNKKKIKLNVEGFDKAPILIGTEQSNGISSLENLSNFNNCNISIKSVNIKDCNEDVVELKTYYTLVVAEDKKYNNNIIYNLEKEKECKLIIEVCLGFKTYKRFILLEVSSNENMLTITNDLPNKIIEMFTDIKETEENESVNIVFYDENGFEIEQKILYKDIPEYIESVRIIDSQDYNIKENATKRTQSFFESIKETGKNSTENISKFTTIITKFMILNKI